MIVIVSGSIGRLPLGGHAWIDMQYLAGLAELGHDVYYLEDAGQGSWVYDWGAEELTTDLGYPADYVRDCLEPLGLAGRWIYRAGDDARGMDVDDFRQVCAQADLLLLRAVPLETWRSEYSLPARRAFVDADPGFTQISLAQGATALQAVAEHCETLFTIAQRIGATDCEIPTAGHTWHRTVAPVCLRHWPVTPADPDAPFTAIMQWRGFREVEWEGRKYGQKDQSFPEYLDFPRMTTARLRVALTGADADVLEPHGWEVVPGWVASLSANDYQRFVQSSRGEFSVAKQGYIAMRGGWFSDRSACYLACGRPVLVSDTGLADWLPVDEGVMTFTSPREAAAGIEAITADYERHARAARRVAEEVFDSSKVLPDLVERATA